MVVVVATHSDQILIKTYLQVHIHGFHSIYHCINRFYLSHTKWITQVKNGVQFVACYLMTFAEGNYPYTSTNRGADVDRREERSSAILPSSARTVISSISLRIRSACSAAPDKSATRAHAARMAIRTGSGNVIFLFITSASAAAEGSTLNVTREGVGTGYRPSSFPQTLYVFS